MASALELLLLARLAEPVSEVDVTPFTVAGTIAVEQVSNYWPIAPSQMVVGAKFRLVVAGQFTISAASPGSGWFTNFGGADTTIIGYAASNPTTAHTYSWRTEHEVTIISTGTSGSALLVASQDQWGPSGSYSERWGATSLLTVDTTVATQLGLDFQWNAITNSPTLTSYTSEFELLGAAA